MMRGTKAVIGLGLGAAAAVGVGCAGGPARYDLVASLDPALASGSTPTIAVNVIGVTDATEAHWSGVSMSRYWAPDSPDRAAAAGQVKEFVFGPGKTEPVTLGRNDPVWNAWGRPTQLVVLANLPGAHDDKPGAADDRRLIIPLDRDRWDADQKIMVTVQRNRLQLVSQPKPVRK